MAIKGWYARRKRSGGASTRKDEGRDGTKAVGICDTPRTHPQSPTCPECGRMKPTCPFCGEVLEPVWAEANVTNLLRKQTWNVTYNHDCPKAVAS